MKDTDYTEALKQHPCPECSQVGHLALQRMAIHATLKGKQIHVEGEGTICGACNTKFMSDEMTEAMVNQLHALESGGRTKYFTVDSSNGRIEPHSLN